MNRQMEVQTEENNQAVGVQQEEQQAVKVEAKTTEQQQVQPIIVPLQIMPCFYTGPYNNAPAQNVAVPVEEKKEEPVEEKTGNVRFSRVETRNVDKKPKEKVKGDKKNALQIACASLLMVVCACMFALSFLGVVELNIDNFFEGSGLQLDAKLEFSTIDLVDGMIATTYDFETEEEFEKSKLAERLKDCEEELQKSLEKDAQSSSEVKLSSKTKKLMGKYVKLSVFVNLSFEETNDSSAEIHFILAGAFSLLYIAVTATMLALSIAWLALVCSGKKSNLGRVTVCMNAALFVVIIMLLIHMMELGATLGGIASLVSLAIPYICALAVCGAVLLFACILGLVRTPKGSRGMVAIKATSAVLALSVLAFAFAPAMVHTLSADSKTMKIESGLGSLEETILTNEQIADIEEIGSDEILSIGEDIEYYLSTLEGFGLEAQLIKMLIATRTNAMFVGSLAVHDAQMMEVYSLGYFMVFAVGVVTAICLALVFDFVLGGKNHAKTELALKVMIVALTLFVLAVCASAIGIANNEYERIGVETVSISIGYGVAMIAVMGILSLVLDSIVMGISNKKAKAVAVQDDVNSEPYQLEEAVA